MAVHTIRSKSAWNTSTVTCRAVAAMMTRRRARRWKEDTSTHASNHYDACVNSLRRMQGRGADGLIRSSVHPLPSLACVVMIRRMRGSTYFPASRSSPRHRRGDGTTCHRGCIPRGFRSDGVYSHQIQIRQRIYPLETVRRTVSIGYPLVCTSPKRVIYRITRSKQRKKKSLQNN